ncbi:MAG: hypothetical protein K2I46_04025 [Clostridia bacterium]|nr:hypothetical protein [Clostridia bacterium]
MKKFFVAIMLVAVLVCAVAFTACSPEDIIPNVDKTYTLVAPDGAPALAVANLITQIPTEKAVYGIKRKVVSSSIISAEAIKSDVDLAIVPANLGAKIFNTSGGYKILDVVTNGNLYMTSSTSCQVNSLQDLKGKIVYSIGQSSVPDMIFKTLLTNAGVEYAVGEEPAVGKVTIKYYADGSEVISQLALAKSENKLAFGIYGEPAVTNSFAKGFEQVFDLQKLWAEIDDSSHDGYAQAVLIARDSVCEDSEFVTKLIKAFTLNESNILEAPTKAVGNIKAIYPQSALQSNITMDVISRCNIKTVATNTLEGRTYYENTLKAVMAINANLIGGKLPSDDFYLG